MTELSAQLEYAASKMGAAFTLKSGKANLKKVFAVDGLLPALARRADQLSVLCLGYGLGVTYEDAEGSLTGSRVKFDDFTPNVLRLFCLIDVLFEIVRASPNSEAVPLDELMYDQ